MNELTWILLQLFLFTGGGGHFAHIFVVFLFVVVVVFQQFECFRFFLLFETFLSIFSGSLKISVPVFLRMCVCVCGCNLLMPKCFWAFQGICFHYHFLMVAANTSLTTLSVSLFHFFSWKKRKKSWQEFLEMMEQRTKSFRTITSSSIDDLKNVQLLAIFCTVCFPKKKKKYLLMQYSDMEFENEKKLEKMKNLNLAKKKRSRQCWWCLS